MKKSLSVVLSMLILVIGLVLVGSVPVDIVHASVPVTGIIGSTTWTKANSPYILTGNVLVSNGAILTIEPGVTVNLNGFYIMLNGTLRAKGTNIDRITFNGGSVIFTNFSVPLNDQFGGVNLIENAVFTNGSVLSSSSIMVNSTYINGNITTVGSSAVINNNITNGLDVRGACSVTNNIITSTVYASGSCTLSNNTITGSVTSKDYVTVTNNIINGNINVNGGTVSHNTISGQVRGGGSQALDGNIALISFNDVRSGIFLSIGSSTVLNNTIKADDIGINLTPNNGVDLSAAIFNNTIIARNTGIFITSSVYIVFIYDWTTNANISGNSIYNCSTAGIQVWGAGNDAPYNNATILNNLISNCGNGIQNSAVGNIEGNIVLNCNTGIVSGNPIRNNIIANNSIGINMGGTIEGNLIVNNQVGINSGNQIRNNTMARNVLGINGSFSTLTFNNFQNNTNNIRYTSSADANASYNWWGTTNLEVINQTIYDYKNDFTLGRVNFSPILTASNPAAPSVNTPISPPPVIPEFQTPIMITILLMVTLAITVARLTKKTTEST